MMNKVTFNDEWCQGCGLCVDACPRNIVALDLNKLNKKGFHPAQVTDIEKCIACAMCAVMCPQTIIKVEKT